MSAPYQVWIDDFGDHRYIDCNTFAEACAKGLDVPERQFRNVRVIGDGYDGGGGDDGTKESSDGLTDYERTVVEALGL